MSLPDAFNPTSEIPNQSEVIVSGSTTPAKKQKHWLIGLFVIFALIIMSGIGGWAVWNKQESPAVETTRPELALVGEAYDTIQQNYWEKLSDEQLSTIFQSAIVRVYGTQPELDQLDKQGVTNMLDQLMKDNPDADHEMLVAQLIDLVLMNLQPFERSRLYTQEDENALNNRVSNIDPDTDLLAELDVDAQASDEAVAQALDQKKQEVTQTASSEAELEAQVAQLDRAYEALATTELRQRYSETKVEPTLSGKQLTDDVFYLRISQFSPTTVEDLQYTLKQAGDKPGSALIIDLRGNVGGAIDGLPYFLGPFIGANQYAYQFFSQGTTKDFKTKTGWLEELVPFKRIVVLVDTKTQSSAEVMAAVLKKYHVGVLVGTPTAGWGTVERVFPLQTTFPSGRSYSLFLVHSLTLNEVGAPIDGNGVEPLVNIRQPDWQNQLQGYFKDAALVEQVEELVDNQE